MELPTFDVKKRSRSTDEGDDGDAPRPRSRWQRAALLTTLVAGALLIDYRRRRPAAAAASLRTGSNTNVRLAAPPRLAVSQSTGSGFGSRGVPDDATAAE